MGNKDKPGKQIAKIITAIAGLITATAGLITAIKL